MKDRYAPFLLLTLITAPVAAQTSLLWGDEIPCSSGGNGNYRPRIVLNADHQPVVLWGRTSPAANLAAVKQGAAFGMAMTVTPAGVQPTVDTWMGSDIAAHGDSIYVVFKRTPEDVGYIYLVSSTNGGLTWSDTLRVDPADGNWTRFACVGAGDDGPIVQYMQFDAGFSNARYVTTRFSNGQFQAPLQASAPFAAGNVCDCCPGQLVAAGSNAVALYRNAGSNIRVIWGSSSIDGAATYEAGVPVDGTAWNLNACPSSGPDGYITGDSIRVVWMSGADNGAKAYIRSAHLPDLATGMMYNVHPGQPMNIQQNYPRIAGNGDTLGVVWDQFDGNDREVLFAWSTTGPGGLSTPDTVNTSHGGLQRNPDIAYANGTFHLTWQDDAAGRVKYRSVSLLSSVGVEEQEASVLRTWPVPVSDVLHLQLPAGISGGRSEVLDALGRRVRSVALTTTLDVRMLSPGTYVLRVSRLDGTVVGASRFSVSR